MSKIAAILVCASTALSFSTSAYAQGFTFSIHHFLSPEAPARTVLLEPWAVVVEETSDGRINFEIFPAMSLGGAPPEVFSQVRDRAAELVWTLPCHTPGTFPRLEVFELPNVHITNGSVEGAADFQGFKVLSPSCTGTWVLEELGAEPVCKKLAEGAGNSVVALSAEASAEFYSSFEAAAQRWVAETDSMGFDGAALLEKARAAVASRSE